MKPNSAKVLLVFYLLFPVGSILYRPLIALTLLSQINSIYLVRQAEKKLGSEEEDSAFADFWKALWLAPTNSSAFAYVGISCRCLIFTSHQHGDRIRGSNFTLVGKTNPKETVQIKILVDNEILVEQGVNADENGYFQVQVEAPPHSPLGTRYHVQANINDSDDFRETTQISLIQD